MPRGLIFNRQLVLKIASEPQVKNGTAPGRLFQCAHKMTHGKNIFFAQTIPTISDSVL